MFSNYGMAEALVTERQQRLRQEAAGLRLARLARRRRHAHPGTGVERPPTGARTIVGFGRRHSPAAAA